MEVSRHELPKFTATNHILTTEFYSETTFFVVRNPDLKSTDPDFAVCHLYWCSSLAQVNFQSVTLDFDEVNPPESTCTAMTGFCTRSMGHGRALSDLVNGAVSGHHG